MKNLLLILAIFPLFASGQLNLSPKSKWVNDSSFWLPIDTIVVVSGNPVLNDSAMYRFSKLPTTILGKADHISTSYLHSNDSLYYELTKTVKTEVMRSRNVISSRRVFRHRLIKIPNSGDDVIEKALIQGKNIDDNDFFWNYPDVNDVINPPLDTIE